MVTWSSLGAAERHRTDKSENEGTKELTLRLTAVFSFATALVRQEEICRARRKIGTLQDRIFHAIHYAESRRLGSALMQSHWQLQSKDKSVFAGIE